MWKKVKCTKNMYLAFLELNTLIDWERRQEGRGAPTTPYLCLPWHAPSLWPPSVDDCCTRGPAEGHARGGRCDGTIVYMTQTWMQGCVQHSGTSWVEYVQFGRDLVFEKVMLVSRRDCQDGFCWLRSAFTLMPPLLAENSMSDGELPQSVW